MARTCNCLSFKWHPCQTKLSPIFFPKTWGFKEETQSSVVVKSNLSDETPWSVQILPQKRGFLPTRWGSGDMNMGDHITSLKLSGLVSVSVSPSLTSEQSRTLVSRKERVVG